MLKKYYFWIKLKQWTSQIYTLTSWKIKINHLNNIQIQSGEDQGEKLVEVLQILKPVNKKYKINWRHVTKTSANSKIKKEFN